MNVYWNSLAWDFWGFQAIILYSIHLNPHNEQLTGTFHSPQNFGYYIFMIDILCFTETIVTKAINNKVQPNLILLTSTRPRKTFRYQIQSIQDIDDKLNSKWFRLQNYSLERSKVWKILVFETKVCQRCIEFFPKKKELCNS